MRKLFICAGLAVAGTASLQAAYAPDLNSMETSKMWSVSGTLRGFYDDNYNTAPSGPSKRASFGFEVSPSLSLNVPLQQTELGLRYTYGLYYYQDRMNFNGRPIDQTHQVDLWMDHAFTERWQTKVEDSLAVGQDPELLNGNIPVRVSGDNFHNDGSITLDTQWTRLLGTKLGYHNNYYDYTGSNPGIPNDYSGLLNRIQNNVFLNVNYIVQPTLTAFIGYQYGQINYIANQQTGTTPQNTKFYSDNRDNRSQYGYVGARYRPLDNVSLGVRAGVQYVDYYNPPAGEPSTDSVSPYANLSATYTYLPGSYVQFGFTQTRNATDILTFSGAGNTATLDQESSIIYAALNHRITPRITGNAVGKIQYSTFNGGSVDGHSQTWYSVGLNVAYAFNPHISAEIGYNFDDLTPEINGQGYNRNRVYVGVTGTY